MAKSYKFHLHKTMSHDYLMQMAYCLRVRVLFKAKTFVKSFAVIYEDPVSVFDTSRIWIEISRKESEHDIHSRMNNLSG